MVHYDLRTQAVKQNFIDQSVLCKQISIKFKFLNFMQNICYNKIKQDIYFITDVVSRAI